MLNCLKVAMVALTALRVPVGFTVRIVHLWFLALHPCELKPVLSLRLRWSADQAAAMESHVLVSVRPGAFSSTTPLPARRGGSGVVPEPAAQHRLPF